MKNILVAAFSVLSIGSVAMARDYNVTVASQHANTVDIRFSTVQINTEMCDLATTRLEVKLVQSDRPGRIAIEAALDPEGICLDSSGPNSGSVTFTRGHALPQLPDGRYELSVDGEAEGTLVVDKNGVRLAD